MQDYYTPRAGRHEGIHIERHLFIISADLGQANDYTAISILQKIIKGPGVLGKPPRHAPTFSFGDDRKPAGEEHFHLRHLERLPRGTDYTMAINRLLELYRSEQLEGYNKAVVIDYTGVGRPVYDVMKQCGFDKSLNAISITGGNDPTYHAAHVNVPKRDLVTNLQVMLQNGEFRIAKGIKEADALVEELANFQVKITASGHDTYGGRSGVHDDLVLSVAMAAWLAVQPRIKIGNDEWM